MSTMHCSLLSLGCVFGFAPPTEENTFTALRSLKVAQRRLRPEVRVKLLSVSSARVDAFSPPQAWRYVFLDPTTSGSCRVVTVAAKNSSEHPDTVEAFSSIRAENIAAMHPMPLNKWLIDSELALEKARETSKLKGAGTVEYRLVSKRKDQEPHWTLHFFSEDGERVAGFEIGAKNGNIHALGSDAKES